MLIFVVVCCLLFVVCCLLFVVCCLFLINKRYSVAPGNYQSVYFSYVGGINTNVVRTLIFVSFIIFYYILL